MRNLLVFGLFCAQALAVNNLDVRFQWRQLDFYFPSEAGRRYALQRGYFIPENNLPLGLEVYKNMVFITIPRWKSGVAASLAYVDLKNPDRSPQLRPYPNWPAHNVEYNSTPEIVSPFRIKADRCGRLWVLDTGAADILGDTKILAHPRVSIYELTNDTLVRQYTIPKDQLKEDSFLGNIAVEVVSCEDTYAYIADLGKGALIVYSWKNNTSWKVTHNFFNVDPLAGEFNVSGIGFEWADGIFGLALSPPNENGFSTLYFHPLVSFNEFSVSTEVLRDPELARNSYHNFTNLGSRGPKGQSTASCLHPKTNILFYGVVNTNAVDCWKTTENYTSETQGRVYQDDVTMVFPNDLKVDDNDNLWVLSDRLPRFMYQKLDPLDVNFRILTAPVSEVIKGTVCDKEQVSSGVMNRFKPSINIPQQESTTSSEDKSAALRAEVSLLACFFALALLKKL